MKQSLKVSWMAGFGLQMVQLFGSHAVMAEAKTAQLFTADIQFLKQKQHLVFKVVTQENDDAFAKLKIQTFDSEGGKLIREEEFSTDALVKTLDPRVSDVKIGSGDLFSIRFLKFEPTSEVSLRLRYITQILGRRYSKKRLDIVYTADHRWTVLSEQREPIVKLTISGNLMGVRRVVAFTEAGKETTLPGTP